MARYSFRIASTYLDTNLHLKAAGLSWLRHMLLQTMHHVPDGTAQQRASIAANLLFHGLADDCKLSEMGQLTHQQAHSQDCIMQMVDAITAILCASPSEALIPEWFSTIEQMG